jgi:hypothetical protein
MSVIYETKITQLTVKPVGEPIYARGGTCISIEDESGGEFVTVSQQGDDVVGKIAINPEEWPALRDAIEKMIKGCTL